MTIAPLPVVLKVCLANCSQCQAVTAAFQKLGARISFEVEQLDLSLCPTAIVGPYEATGRGAIMALMKHHGF